MLAVIRQTVPATRSMSDGRLLALVLAVGLLVMVATDATAVGIAVGAAMLMTVFHRQRSCGRRVRRPVDTDVADLASAATDERTPASPAEDPLVARARALRERTLARF